MGIFERFTEIPKETKKSGAYKIYLQEFLTYLKDFIGRAKPLIDIQRECELIDKVIYYFDFYSFLRILKQNGEMKKFPGGVKKEPQKL